MVYLCAFSLPTRMNLCLKNECLGTYCLCACRCICVCEMSGHLYPQFVFLGSFVKGVFSINGCPHVYDTCAHMAAYECVFYT